MEKTEEKQEVTREQSKDALLATGVIMLIAIAQEEAPQLMASEVWTHARNSIMRTQAMNETLLLIYRQTEEQDMVVKIQ